MRRVTGDSGGIVSGCTRKSSRALTSGLRRAFTKARSLIDSVFVSTPVEESRMMSTGKRRSLRERSLTREVGNDNRWMLVVVHHKGKAERITAQYAASIDHLTFLD